MHLGFLVLWYRSMVLQFFCITTCIQISESYVYYKAMQADTIS